MILGLTLCGCAIPEQKTINPSSKIIVGANKDIISLVTLKAYEHNIPVGLAHAVIHTESRYHANAKHSVHYGLGQINCKTAKGIGFKGECKLLFNPEINLDYSFKYLRMALDLAKDNECHAATLYQGGLGVKPRSSRYCKRVLAKISLIEVSSNR